MSWTELFITVGVTTLFIPSKSGLKWEHVEAIVEVNAEDGGLDRARAVSTDGQEKHWNPRHLWSAEPEAPVEEVTTGLEGRRIAADPAKEMMPGTDFTGYGVILYGIDEDYQCRFPTQSGGHLDVRLTDKDIILLPDVIEMGVFDNGEETARYDVTEAVLHSPVEDISQLRDGPADENAQKLGGETPLKELLSKLGSSSIDIVSEIADYFGVSSSVDLETGQKMVSNTDLKGLLEIYDQALVVHEFVQSQKYENGIGHP